MLHENKNIEYKSQYTDGIKKTVVAFANTEGGKIYIGVNDDGSICGVDNVDDIQSKLTNMIRDAIRPDVTMFTSCSVEEIESKNVLILTVQRGTERPYHLNAKGIRPEGVFVRQGASSVPASKNAILHMIQETSGNKYEDARSLNQELTFEQAAAYFAKKNVAFEEVQKRNLHIIGTDGSYTNLGLLLSDQCPHTIKIAVFEGNSKMVFKDRTELSGSLIQQLQDAYAYIDRFNKNRAEFEGLERVETRDYPVEALREALVNSIEHRDYAISSSIMINIYDNNIEFINIGGLVHDLSKDDILTGLSILRNPNLANVFYRLMLIEAYGKGLKTIDNCYANHTIKPDIEITQNVFKITLPNLNCQQEGSFLESIQVLLTSAEHIQRSIIEFENEYHFLAKIAAFQKAIIEFNNEYNIPQIIQALLPLNSDERFNNVLFLLNSDERIEKVLSLFKDKDSIVRKDVDELLRVAQSTSSILLRKMLDNELLVQEGVGRNIKYRLTELTKAYLNKDKEQTDSNGD